MTGRATSRDGRVTVIVSPSGALLDLRLDAGALAAGPDALAAQVLATSAAA
ncbi:MAG: YbaB/EbfC DNA-binding family, partial [Frankiales bacterium]|nr:YbaB/EbfC DNA-binding family [Frankiales bacterium]